MLKQLHNFYFEEKKVEPQNTVFKERERESDSAFKTLTSMCKKCSHGWNNLTHFYLGNTWQSFTFSLYSWKESSTIPCFDQLDSSAFVQPVCFGSCTDVPVVCGLYGPFLFNCQREGGKLPPAPKYHSVCSLQHSSKEQVSRLLPGLFGVICRKKSFSPL